MAPPSSDLAEWAARHSRPIAWLLTAVVAGVGLLLVHAPMLADWSTYGFHDWDVSSAYRLITTVSLKQYGEAPWWHPWFCGGVPAFGYPEGAPNLISPWLPLYLLLDVRHAVRVEVLLSAVIGFAGAFCWAGFFSRSAALRALVAVLFVLNSRWAMQAAVGHTWHLQFCWLPWCLYCFERARKAGGLPWAVAGGGVLALMIYQGAIYPVPYLLLALALYAALLALSTRSWSPLVAAALVSGIGAALAAPKIAAVLDWLSRFPRHVRSPEEIGLGQLLVMLLSREQFFGATPVPVPLWGWHEYGIYLGVAGVGILLLGLVRPRGARGRAAQILGALFLVCGLGAVHEYAPWPLLRRLPLFASMHVPSRFLFPMVLFLAVAAASRLSALLEPQVQRRPWLELALFVPLLGLTIDLGQVGAASFERAWWMRAPAIEPSAQFRQTLRGAGLDYLERDGWRRSVLLPMRANRGVLSCYGIPGFRARGALAEEQAAYRGEAYLADGAGEATLATWSPNRAVIRVVGAQPGALLVYNTNFDPSWRVDGRPALNHRNAVATRLASGSQTVEFRYRPRTLAWSLPTALVTLGLCLVLCLRSRRRAR